MSSKSKIDLSEFIDPEFKADKYFDAEENIQGKSQEVKDAWREIFSFANAINRAGRPHTPTDIQNITQQHDTKIPGLDFRKVESLFVKIFEQNKDEYGLDNKPDIVKVEVYLKKHFDFAYNEVSQTTEFKRKESETWEDLNCDTVYRKLQYAGYKFGLDKIKSLLKSDFVPVYNPFRAYFEGLEKWDGERDYIEELASFVQTTDTQFYIAQFKKALVRSIGCALYNRENRIVFTYIGEKQSTGKSSFIRFLSPWGDERYYTEAPIRNNKDSEFAFAENFIYNLEELTAANNTEVSRLKAIISLSSIKERKAYAVNATSQPRRCNFWASANKDEFLTDTENTRWLIFRVLSIDWNYRAKVNIHRVWSQAYALYHTPEFNAQLTAEEAARRELVNREYEVNDLVKELLKRTFLKCWKGEGQFYSNLELFQIIQAQTSKTLDAKYIGNFMSQLGFVKDSRKINGSPVRGWWAILVDESDRAAYTPVDLDVKF